MSIGSIRKGHLFCQKLYVYTDWVAETCSSLVCVYAVHYITFRIGKKSEHSHILPTLASK